MAAAKAHDGVTTVELRHKLGEILGKAHYRGEQTIALHHGMPYAAIVSLKDAELAQRINELPDEQRAEVLNLLTRSEELNALAGKPAERSRAIDPTQFLNKDDDGITR